jgi:tripartite-type tricarboxylate transporter receptor subunit TctC
LLGPARMPPAAIARLAEALRGVMAAPEIMPRMDALAVLPRATGPAPLAALVRSDLARISDLVRSQNIRPQ